MTDENSVDELGDGFDDGWGDGPEDVDALEEDARQTEHDGEDLTPDDDQDADDDQDSEKESVEEQEPSVDKSQIEAELEREKQRYRSAEGRLKKFEADMDAMRQNMEAMQKRLANPDKPSNQEEAPAADDDSEFRDPEFAKQYDPDLDAELAKRAKKAADSAYNRAKQEMQAQQDQKRQAEAQQAFVDSLRSSVDGYDELVEMDGFGEELGGFIEEQSPALRRAYQLAFDQGTAEEVADLLNAFKQSRTKDEGDKDEIEDNSNSQQRNDVKRKQNAAAAVKSRRSAIPRDKGAGPSKDDLDAGWNDGEN